MAILSVQISDEVDTQFRTELAKRGLKGRGSMGKTVESALLLWIRTKPKTE
jgi:hypothetical protein